MPHKPCPIKDMDYSDIVGINDIHIIIYIEYKLYIKITHCNKTHYTFKRLNYNIKRESLIRIYK